MGAARGHRTATPAPSASEKTAAAAAVVGVVCDTAHHSITINATGAPAAAAAAPAAAPPAAAAAAAETAGQITAAAPAKQTSFRRVVTHNFISRTDSEGRPPSRTLDKQESSLHQANSSLKRAGAASSLRERQQTAAAPLLRREQEGGGGGRAPTKEQGLVVTAANAALPPGSALGIHFDHERHFKFEQLVNWNAVVVVYRRAAPLRRRLLTVAGVGPFSHCEIYLPSDGETFTILRGGTMQSCGEAGKAYEAFPTSYAWHMWILTDLEYQRIIDWNLDQADSQCEYSARDLAYRLLPSALHASLAPDVSEQDARNPRKLFNTQAVILAMRHALGASDSKARSSQFLLSLNSRLTTPSELAQRTAAFFQVPVSSEPVPLTRKEATAMSRHSVTYRPYLKRYPHTGRRLVVD